jgi:CBS domain-containing protein
VAQRPAEVAEHRVDGLVDDPATPEDRLLRDRAAAAQEVRELLGVISREQVLHSLANSPLDEPVSSVMVRAIPHVQSGLGIDEVRQIMAQHESRVVAVFDGETYLGLVNADDLAEALVLIAYEQRHQAMQQARTPVPIPPPVPTSPYVGRAWPETP